MDKIVEEIKKVIDEKTKDLGRDDCWNVLDAVFDDIVSRLDALDDALDDELSKEEGK